MNQKLLEMHVAKVAVRYAQRELDRLVRPVVQVIAREGEALVRLEPNEFDGGIPLVLHVQRTAHVSHVRDGGVEKWEVVNETCDADWARNGGDAASREVVAF